MEKGQEQNVGGGPTHFRPGAAQDLAATAQHVRVRLQLLSTQHHRRGAVPATVRRDPAHAGVPGLRPVAEEP